MPESNRIESLFNKYLDESITRDEFNEFWTLLGEQDYNGLSPQLQNLWIRTEGIAPFYSDEEWNRKLKSLIQKAEEEDAQWKKFRERKVRHISVRTRWIAAASVIIIASLIFVISKRSEKSPPQVAVTHDIQAPSNTRAVITLADGSKVYLDSVNNGTIAQQDNVNVVKSNNGEINYSLSANNEQRSANSLSYNTLSNPRGSKVISLTLSDGTKVWLNSESSLKYPIAFNGNTREVEITGEAYFEVKHNSKQPFKVHLPNGSIIEDVGTSFNVNAYADESDIKTSLVEGSVRVVGDAALNTNNGRSSVVLKPGEQAVLSATHHSLLTTHCDLEEVTAWKNGFFQFNRASLQDVMKQISRWYDVDVSYSGNIPSRQFGGKINRNMNASQVLKILEESEVHFKIEGKEIIVMP